LERPNFTAVKLQSSNITDCEQFFGSVFGFEVTRRYGGEPGASFAEIVMTLRGEKGMMLKFIQTADEPVSATGTTIQIALSEIEPTLTAALAAKATVVMAPTEFPEAGVRMAVISTDQGLGIELVQDI
jgi:predicted enzyme related to lactoylglutathione lyase